MNLKPTKIVISHCLHGSDFAALGNPSDANEAIESLDLPDEIGGCKLWNVEIIQYRVAIVQDKKKKQFEIKAYYK